MSDFIQIVKGEDKTVKVNLKKEDGTPYALAGVTAVTISFPKTDGTALDKTGSIVSSDAGQVQCILDNTDTASLKEGKRQPMYVTLDKTADKLIVVTGLETACSIVSKPF